MILGIRHLCVSRTLCVSFPKAFTILARSNRNMNSIRIMSPFSNKIGWNNSMQNNGCRLFSSSKGKSKSGSDYTKVSRAKDSTVEKDPSIEEDSSMENEPFIIKNDDPQTIFFNKKLGQMLSTDGLEEVLSEMKEKNVPWNSSTYMYVIHLYTKSGQLKEAMGLLTKYGRRHPNVCLDSETYYSVGKLLIERGQLQKAFEFLSGVEKRGFMKPSLPLYRELYLKTAKEQGMSTLFMKLSDHLRGNGLIRNISRSVSPAIWHSILEPIRGLPKTPADEDAGEVPEQGAEKKDGEEEVELPEDNAKRDVGSSENLDEDMIDQQFSMDGIDEETKKMAEDIKKQEKRVKEIISAPQKKPKKDNKTPKSQNDSKDDEGSKK